MMGRRAEVSRNAQEKMKPLKHGASAAVVILYYLTCVICRRGLFLVTVATSVCLSDHVEVHSRGNAIRGFLSRVCMFSLCLAGFPPGIRVN